MGCSKSKSVKTREAKLASEPPSGPSGGSDVDKEDPSAGQASRGLDSVCLRGDSYQTRGEQFVSLGTAKASQPEDKPDPSPPPAIPGKPVGFLGGIASDYHCGFKITAEPEFLRCSESKQAAFSLPAECLTHVPEPDQVITTFKTGDQERKISCNIKISDAEMELLKQLQSQAADTPIWPSVAVAAVRYISTARKNVEKAWTMMLESIEWKKEFFAKGPLTDELLASDIAHGIMYFSGRDYALRPLLVIRAARIPKRWYEEGAVEKFVRLIAFHMEYLIRYMIVPGRVENIICLIDLNGLGLADVPFSALKQVYSVLNRHYGGRLYRLYICNLSWTLKTLSSAVMNLVTDRQRQKLCILADSAQMKSEFSASFAAHHLETDLGGTRPEIKEFLPFPLLPGPFTKGYSGPPRSDAISNVHKVMTRAGFMGRLWDVTKSDEDNQKIQYEMGSADILRKCGITPPPEILPAGVTEQTGVAPPSPEPTQGPPESKSLTNMLSIPPKLSSIQSAEEEGDHDPAFLPADIDEKGASESTAIANQSAFCCKPCRVALSE
jgi:hypothetical protein